MLKMRCVPDLGEWMKPYVRNWYQWSGLVRVSLVTPNQSTGSCLFSKKSPTT